MCIAPCARALSRLKGVAYSRCYATALSFLSSLFRSPEPVVIKSLSWENGVVRLSKEDSAVLASPKYSYRPIAIIDGEPIWCLPPCRGPIGWCRRFLNHARFLKNPEVSGSALAILVGMSLPVVLVLAALIALLLVLG